MTDMTTYRAALACEYAAHDLRKSHNYAIAAEIMGGNPFNCINNALLDAIKNLKEAAELLGFELTEKETPHETQVASPNADLSTVALPSLRVSTPHHSYAERRAFFDLDAMRDA